MPNERDLRGAIARQTGLRRCESTISVLPPDLEGSCPATSQRLRGNALGQLARHRETLGGSAHRPSQSASPTAQGRRSVQHDPQADDRAPHRAPPDRRALAGDGHHRPGHRRRLRLAGLLPGRTRRLPRQAVPHLQVSHHGPRRRPDRRRDDRTGRSPHHPGRPIAAKDRSTSSRNCSTSSAARCFIGPRPELPHYTEQYGGLRSASDPPRHHRLQFDRVHQPRPGRRRR